MEPFVRASESKCKGQVLDDDCLVCDWINYLPVNINHELLFRQNNGMLFALVMVK